ncbi:MAG: hypothetical protein U1E65_29445 [Myxococcota bacterium]
MFFQRLIPVCCLILLGACSSAGVQDVGAPDAAQLDAEPEDKGTAVPDSGPADAFADASEADAAAPDALAVDTGAPDLGMPDLGAADAEVDAGTGVDAEALDAAPADTGPILSSTASWSAAAGLPDTACPTWTLIDTANPEAPLIQNGILEISDDQESENMYFLQDGASLIAPPHLIIEARMRYGSGAASTPSRTPAVIGFRLGPGLDKQLFQIGEGEAFLLSSENVRGSSTTTPTSDAFHDYRVEAELPGGAVRVFQDGRLILTGGVYPEPNAAAGPAILFGEGSVFAFGASEWISVSHNAHAPIACP